MKSIIQFFKGVRAEGKKVIWPTRDTVIRSTIMILVAAGLVSLFLFSIDQLLSLIVGWIF